MAVAQLVELAHDPEVTTNVLCRCIVATEAALGEDVFHDRSTGKHSWSWGVLWTLLAGAGARHGRVDVCRLCLERGSDPDADTGSGHTALYYASVENCIDCAELLLDYGAKVDGLAFDVASDSEEMDAASTSSTPLHVACRYGNDGMVRRLLSAGARVDPTEEDGSTPLHTAAQSGGSLECVRTLLDYGADVNSVRQRDGMTPLHIASSHGMTRCVEILLSAGASLSLAVPSAIGSQPLHLACAAKRRTVALRPLEYGADPAATRDDGVTPAVAAGMPSSGGIPDVALAGGLETAQHDRNEAIVQLREAVWGISY